MLVIRYIIVYVCIMKLKATNQIHLIIKAQEGLGIECWVDESVSIRQAKFLRRYYSRYAKSIDCYLAPLGNNVYQVQSR